MINRLIRGAIQTGVFASIFSLGGLIGFLASPNTNLYGMFAIPIGRVYTAVSNVSLVQGIEAHTKGLDADGYTTLPREIEGHYVQSWGREYSCANSSHPSFKSPLNLTSFLSESRPLG